MFFVLFCLRIGNRVWQLAVFVDADFLNYVSLCSILVAKDIFCSPYFFIFFADLI